MTLREIDTPALLLDLDAMERNLSRMARFFSAGPTRLRPHYKNHKCPVLARRQMDAGAIGMTCATLSEAEAVIANGITDILISSELAGDRKIARFIELARRADVKAVVDNPKAAAALGAACRAKGCRPGVLVNVNVGQNRTGVKPGEPVLELARKVLAEGLSLRGLMGYEGHVAHQVEGPEKESAYDLAMGSLMKCRCLLEENGIPVEIVSTGGTGTHHLTPRFPGITEFQAGSYLVMDTEYTNTCQDFERALTVLGTVISKAEGERVVVDAGLKSISGEHGIPVVKARDGLRLRRLNAEHGIIDILDPSVPVEVGDIIEIWVYYSDATVNLHERMYGIRNGKVEEVLKLLG
ncbi:MAG TPA: DSD1 family PLP-dependent enzyme [Bryobacteraceae bacterium]|nr:DSD1 family PLP-dependent enzyme [Bryobacteraceae bacterium]